MPRFFKKLFGLRPKPKIKVPKFRNSMEYFEWKARVMGESSLPESIQQNRERIASLKKNEFNTKEQIEKDLKQMNKEIKNTINGQKRTK